MKYIQARNCTWKWDAKGTEAQTDYPIPARRPVLVLIYKKKKLVILSILPFQQTTVNAKEDEMLDKYLSQSAGTVEYTDCTSA